MRRFYKVFKTADNENLVTLPGGLLKAAGLKENDTVSLNFGTMTATAAVKSAKAGSPEKLSLGLSARVFCALKIPDGLRLLAKNTGDKKFRLGPVIGILTFSSHIPRRLSYYYNYYLKNKFGGLIYVFSGKGINVKKQVISGYYYDTRARTWKTGEFPFPDAVLDRCYPTVRAYHTLLERIIGPGKISNKKNLINKIDFTETLNADPVLRAYVPETMKIHDVADVLYFIQKYRTVFLKPSNAMQGKGIIVVKKHGEGFECNFQLHGKDVIKVVPSADEIMGLLRSVTGRKRTYLVQPAVDCMEYCGSPFSIRTCPTKDVTGRWIMPGMIALGAYGKTKSLITNYASGGRRIPLQDLFGAIVPNLAYTRDELTSLLESLSLKVAQVLDKRFGPLGELGLDLVIDRNGKPWVLEANGNPNRRAAYKQTEYPHWPARLYEYILGYAVYLAGFTGQS